MIILNKDAKIINDKLNVLIDNLEKAKAEEICVFEQIKSSFTIEGFKLVQMVNKKFNFEHIGQEENEIITRMVFEIADSEEMIDKVLDIGILYGLNVIDTTVYKKPKVKTIGSLLNTSRKLKCKI